MTRETELRKGCGKAVLNLNGVIVNYCGKLVREDNSLGNPDLCPTCQEKLEIFTETKEKIIKLFKEDSIYTGAVIKLEINNNI